MAKRVIYKLQCGDHEPLPQFWHNSAPSLWRKTLTNLCSEDDNNLLPNVGCRCNAATGQVECPDGAGNAILRAGLLRKCLAECDCADYDSDTGSTPSDRGSTSGEVRGEGWPVPGGFKEAWLEGYLERTGSRKDMDSVE